MTDLLASLPLRRTWLADIVEVLLHRPGGTAEVATIAAIIARTDRDMGDTPDQTITRTINNYCSDARDTGRTVQHDLFERTAPGTYRMRSYPSTPDLVEIQNIEFDDSIEGGACSMYWEALRQIGTRAGRWNQITNRERLEIFAKAISPGGQWHDRYLSEVVYRRSAFDDLVAKVDIGDFL